MSKLSKLKALQNQIYDDGYNVKRANKKIMKECVKGSVIGAFLAFAVGEVAKSLHFLKHYSQLNELKQGYLLNFYEKINPENVNMDRYMQMLEELKSYAEYQVFQIDNFPKFQAMLGLSIFGIVSFSFLFKAYLDYRAERNKYTISKRKFWEKIK